MSQSRPRCVLSSLLLQSQRGTEGQAAGRDSAELNPLDQEPFTEKESTKDRTVQNACPGGGARETIVGVRAKGICASCFKKRTHVRRQWICPVHHVRPQWYVAQKTQQKVCDHPFSPFVIKQKIHAPHLETLPLAPRTSGHHLDGIRSLDVTLQVFDSEACSWHCSLLLFVWPPHCDQGLLLLLLELHFSPRLCYMEPLTKVPTAQSLCGQLTLCPAGLQAFGAMSKPPGVQGQLRGAFKICLQPNQCLHLPSYVGMPRDALITCVVIKQRHCRRGNRVVCLMGSRISPHSPFPLLSLPSTPTITHIRKSKFPFNAFPTSCT